MIVSDVRLLVGPPSCTSPFTPRQSHQVRSAPVPRISLYFKQLIFGALVRLLFHELLGLQLRRLHYDGALSARTSLSFSFRTVDRGCGGSIRWEEKRVSWFRQD